MSTPPVPPIGVPPEVWGPITWTTLHIVTLAYAVAPSAEEQAAARAFVTSLQHLLPCPKCRTHLTALLVELPPDVSSRDAFFAWAVRLHNAVNARLGKQQMTEGEVVAHLAALGGATSLPFGGGGRRLPMLAFAAVAVAAAAGGYLLARATLRGGRP